VSETTEPQTRSPWLTVGYAIAAYAAFRFTLSVLRLPISTPNEVLALASLFTAVGAIALPIWAIASLTRALRGPAQSVLIAIAGLALWLSLLLVRPTPSVAPVLATLMDLGKILAAGGIGMALAAGLKEPNILLPAGLFAAFADFVVVTIGTVKHAQSTEKGQKLIEAVSAKAPAVHPRLTTLTVGPADFLFLGVFLACVLRFDLGLRRNAIALAVVLAGSLMLVALTGISIPALAPMSLTFIALNWRKFKLTKQEVLSTFVVLGLVGALFVGYFVMLGKR
jgi:hypothetical protein